MNSNPILIVPGEPKSIFFEIFFKSIKITKINSPLILICNKKNLYQEIKRFNFKQRIDELDKNFIYKKINKKIYFINISDKHPKFTYKNALNLLFLC